MASIGHIERTIAQLPDAELREVSMAIVKKVAAMLPDVKSPFWTIGLISDWVGRDSRDPALARSLQLLVNLHSAQLLDIHYIYFDRAGNNPDGKKISDEEVRLAYSSGSLEDPDTGELVEDFESTLEPYFVPAPNLELVDKA